MLTGWVLRSRQPCLVIGVRSAGSGIEAHAWIEIDGTSLDPESVHFDRLDGSSGLVDEAIR